MMNNIKTRIKGDILMGMSDYLSHDLMQMLEELINEQFAKINMEEITTLPAEYRTSTSERNRYIIQLYMYKKKNLKRTTMEAYMGAVKRFILAFDKPLDKVDDLDIQHYLNLYEKRNLSAGGSRNQASTINNERRFLSAFFTWMRKEKLIADNPVESTEPVKEVRKPIDYFKAEEMVCLKDGCHTPRDRAIVEVLRSTGARVGEIVSITKNMIDWRTGDIMILGEKNDQYRPIYLDTDARHYLKLYLDSRTDSNPSLFVHDRKPCETLDRGGIRAVLKRIAGRAGVTSRVYPHKMRKTLGMTLKNKGVDIGTIQEIMGHKDPGVTGRYYAQSTPDTLRYIRDRAS